MIREYIDGVNLGERGVYLDREQQSMLENTVLALHGRGITNLDLYYGNVVINQEGFPHLFDLGLVKFREQSYRDHQLYAKEDLADLQKLFTDFRAPEA